MDDLPAKRVQPARPFAHSRVDYAGPFLLKTSRHRGTNCIKAILSYLYACVRRQYI